MKEQKLPVEVKEKLIAELGSATDAELARKYTELSGKPVERHTIFYLRKMRNIPAFEQRRYSQPPFRGRVEKAHPEIASLLGKVPVIRISEKFSVSRSCIRAAAHRLGLSTHVTNFDAAFKEAGISEQTPDCI